MLAIIIPYYKRSFFEEALESLANQTDKRFKVYIGDDASSENPMELLERYNGIVDFVYYKFDENLGGISLTKQWDRCIALSGNEEWLMILGDDDVLGETVIASWYAKFGLFSEKSNIVRFASKIIYEEVKTDSEIYSHPVWELATDSLYRKHKNLTRSSLSEYIFSRASYIKYGFQDYPLAWHSDDWAWLEFSDDKPIFSINESLVYVRISNSSISGNKDNFYQKDIETIEFYKFIIFKKLKFYNKQQRHQFLDKYENAIKKIRKPYLFEWFMIFFYYLKYFDYYSLKRVLKRFIKSAISYE